MRLLLAIIIPFFWISGIVSGYQDIPTCVKDEYGDFPLCPGRTIYEFCDGENDCNDTTYCNCRVGRAFCQTKINPCDNEEDYYYSEEQEQPSSCDEEMCFSALEMGPCRLEIPRFGFQADTGECTEFIYGGCLGNGNNFESKGACESACANCLSGSTKSDTEDIPEGEDYYDSEEKSGRLLCDEELCFSSLDAGPCRLDIPRFGFQADTGECTEFGYGGCLGNDNNFESREACENRCLGCRDWILQ